MKKLKIGVVGAAGGQGNSWCRRIKGWAQTEVFDIELAALCDRNEQGLNHRKTEYKVPFATTDYDSFVKQDLDLIIIATPHFLHAPMTIRAAEEDLNILCEKPMAVTCREADSMRRAVRMNDIIFAVGFQHRFTPRYRGLKAVLDNDEIGKLFQLNLLARHWRTEIYYQMSTPAIDPVNKEEHPWRGYWNTEGGGALANQMIHFIDIFQWLGGPIHSVMAQSTVAKHTFIEVDDNTNAIVSFKDGHMGLIQAGVAYEYGNDTEMSLFGTKGSVVSREDLFDEKGIRIVALDERTKKGKKRNLVPPGFSPDMEMFANLYENLIGDEDADPISVDVIEGKKSVELMRGIFLSNIEEKKVTFPVHDPCVYPTLPHTYDEFLDSM